MPDAAALAKDFHAAINQRDLAALDALMSDDHCFVDSAGGCVEGKGACLAAWRGFFDAFPDYRNECEVVSASGDRVAMSGRSRCSDERLDGPALWSATVTQDGLLARWSVYEDTPDNRSILGLPAG